MIRLQRTGRKHEPTFRVVLTDSKSGPQSGKFLEILGSYDARQKDRATIKKDRITHWLSQGAKASDTVHNVLVDQGVVEGKKKNALPKKTAPVKETPVVEEVKAAAPVAEETPAVEEAPVVEETVEVAAEETPAEAPTEETTAPEETPAA